jgi:hypothetical protein
MNSIDRINRIYKIHFGKATMLSYPVLTIQEGRNAVDRNRTYRIHLMAAWQCFHLVNPVNPVDSSSSTPHVAKEHINDDENYNHRETAAAPPPGRCAGQTSA